MFRTFVYQSEYPVAEPLQPSLALGQERFMSPTSPFPPSVSSPGEKFPPQFSSSKDVQMSSTTLFPVAALLGQKSSIDSSQYTSGIPHENHTENPSRTAIAAAARKTSLPPTSPLLSVGVIPAYHPSPATPDAKAPERYFHRVVQTPTEQLGTRSTSRTEKYQHDNEEATTNNNREPSVVHRKYPPSLSQSVMASSASSLQSPNTVRMLQSQPTNNALWHGIPINNKMAPYASSPFLLTSKRFIGQSAAVGDIVKRVGNHNIGTQLDRTNHERDQSLENNVVMPNEIGKHATKEPDNRPLGEQQSPQLSLRSVHDSEETNTKVVTMNSALLRATESPVSKLQKSTNVSAAAPSMNEAPVRSSIILPSQRQSFGSFKINTEKPENFEYSADQAVTTGFGPMTDSYRSTVAAAIETAAKAARYSTAVVCKREEIEEEESNDINDQTAPATHKSHRLLQSATALQSEWQPRQQQQWPWSGLNTSPPSSSDALHSSSPPIISQLPDRETASTAIINATSNSRHSPEAHRIHIGDQSYQPELRKAVFVTADEVLRAEIKALVGMRERGITTPNSPVMTIGQKANGQAALLDDASSTYYFGRKASQPWEKEYVGAAGALVKFSSAADSPIEAARKPNHFSAEGTEGTLTTPDRRHEFLHRELGPSIDPPSMTPNGEGRSPIDQYDPTSKRIIEGPTNSYKGPPTDPDSFHLSMDRYLGDTHEGVRAGAAFDIMTCAKIIAAVWERFSKRHTTLTTKLPLSTPLQAEIGNLVRHEMLRASVSYGKLVEEPYFFGSSSVHPTPYTPIQLAGKVIAQKLAADERLQIVKGLDSIPRKPPAVWMANETYRNYPPPPIPHQPTKPIFAPSSKRDGKTSPEDLRASPNIQYQHAAAIAIAADLSMNHAQVAMGEPSFVSNVNGAGEASVVLTASVNREMDLQTAPPVWSLSLGNVASKTVVSIESLQYLRKAQVSQVLKTEEQSVFVLELFPGAVRSGEQYTVWFKPTPSSSQTESKSFRMP